MAKTKAIAYLGPEGTHSQLALEEYHPQGQTLACRTIADILEKIVKEEVAAGIVPTENMIQGPITETYDQIFAHKGELQIIDSHLMTINHSFGVLPPELCGGANWPREITSIYSHEQALRQCSKFLLENFPKAQLIPTTSTAAGIEFIKAQGLTGAAVIAPAISLRKAGFQVIHQEISDIPGNKTRFAVLIKKGNKADFLSILKPSQYQHVTSLLLAPGRDRQGLLFDLLRIISMEHKINLVTIHSRPDLRGRVVFYLDLEGNAETEKIKNCLEELKNFCINATGKSAEVMNLGSYPYTLFYNPPIKVVGIIGINGKMGQWFKKFLLECGLTVIGCDLNTDLKLSDIAAKADTILISVPMSEASKVSKKLLPLLKAGQLVVENCSIKECILPELIANAPEGVEVLGVHTMFSGDAENIYGENAIITKTTKSAEKAQAFEDLLYKHGAKIAHISGEKHDQTTAFVQSLLQLCMLILADSMSNEFSSLKEIELISTPNFRNTLETITRVLNQSDSLIFDLQTLNPKAIKMRNKFLESAFKLISALNQGNLEIIEKSLVESRKFIL